MKPQNLIKCKVSIQEQNILFPQRKFIVFLQWYSNILGAAKGLYEEDYYRCLKEALKPNGIICSQGQHI